MVLSRARHHRHLQAATLQVADDILGLLEVLPPPPPLLETEPVASSTGATAAAAAATCTSAEQAGVEQGPSSSSGADASTSTSSASALTFARAFMLEFPLAIGDSVEHCSPLLMLRLMRPATARLGQPTMLKWQLRRLVGAETGSDTAMVIRYDVSTDAAAGTGGWYVGPTGCSGRVRLGHARGSVATVEAVVVPQDVGPLHAPRLLLRGLQDVVRDDSAGGGAAVVMVGL